MERALATTRGNVASALDFVCLHMPHDELPKGFSDKVYASDDGNLTVATSACGADDEDVAADADDRCVDESTSKQGGASNPSPNERQFGHKEIDRETTTTLERACEPALTGAADDLSSNTTTQSRSSESVHHPLAVDVAGKSAVFPLAKLSGHSAPAVNNAWILRYAEEMSSSDDGDDDYGASYGLRGGGGRGGHKEDMADPVDQYRSALHELALLVADAASAKAAGNKSLQRELGVRISGLKAKMSQLERSGGFDAVSVREEVERERLMRLSVSENDPSAARTDDVDSTTSANRNQELAAIQINSDVDISRCSFSELHKQNDAHTASELSGASGSDRDTQGAHASGAGHDIATATDSDDDGSTAGAFDIFDEDDDTIADGGNVNQNDSAEGAAASVGDDSSRFPNLRNWPTRFVTPSWTGKTPRDLLGEVTRTLFRGARAPSFRKGGE